jgi:hypothetical protein
LLKGISQKISRCLNSFGTITLVFSTLSAFAKLESFGEFLDLLSGISEEVLIIIDFFGRIINFVLIPYRWLTDLFFQIIPLNIPIDWHDPVIIGLMVLFVPIFEFRNLVRYGSPIIAINNIKRLTRLLKKKSNLRNEQSISKLKSEIKRFNTFKISKNLEKLSENYIKSLEDNHDIAKIENERLDLKRTIDSKLLPCISELKEISSNYYKKIKFIRKRGAVAIAVLILLSLDSIYSKSNFEFLSIISKSMLTIVIFCILPFIFLGFIILSFYLVRLITRIIIATRVFSSERNAKLDTSSDILVALGWTIGLAPFGFFNFRVIEGFNEKVTHILQSNLI